MAGDFDFLSGHWAIAHRRRKPGSDEEWDCFDGEATCWSILGGSVSVEELRIPARQFSGMGLRRLNKETHIWSDCWLNADSGVLHPPVEGYFEQGQGIFIAHEMEGDQVILVRGLWDDIGATSCSWEQAVSRDGGASWQANWSMHWTRVGQGRVA